jgi:hypothetical protein
MFEEETGHGEGDSIDSPQAQPTTWPSVATDATDFELTAPEPTPLEPEPRDRAISEVEPNENSQLSMALADPEGTDSPAPTPVDLLELPPPETVEEAVALGGESAIAADPLLPMSESVAVRSDHESSLATLPPFANLTPARRSLWLIVLLVVAVIAGIAAGVAIARSFGDPPTAPSKR